MIRNFLYRVARYLHENRASLIRWLFIAIAALIIVLLIRYGVERWQAARYEKRVNALETEVRAAETKAKEAEDRAANIQLVIEDKYVELRELAVRAIAAETALRNTRGRVVTLKEQYETIRYLPVPSDPVSCADACAQLAAVNYKCQ